MNIHMINISIAQRIDSNYSVTKVSNVDITKPIFFILNQVDSSV